LSDLRHDRAGCGVADLRFGGMRYALESMVVLRCTQKLLFRLKQFDDAPAVRSTTRLGDWYGDLLRMGNRHALLFISERSRLPVLIPVREANRLRAAFPDAVWQALAAVAVPADVGAQERFQMSEIAFGRTSSRSLRGSLANFSFLARTRFITSRHETLERIARDLAETPLSAPFDGARPSAVTRKLFGVEGATPIGWRRVAPVRDCPEALGRLKGPLATLAASAPLTRPARSRRAGNYRSDEEVRRAACGAPHLPVVLQPASPTSGILQPQGRSIFLRLQLACDEAVQHMKILGGQLFC
jgi:hypothetical protein